MAPTASLLGDSIKQTEFAILVEKNADGIIVVDERGTVLFTNPAAQEIFGRTSKELAGTHIGVPIVAGETSEIAIRRPSGDYVETEIRAVGTIWNGAPACLATLRNISGRRAIEEQRRHSAKMEAVGRLTAGIAHDFNNLLTVVLGNLEHVQREITDEHLRRGIENAIRGAERAARLTGRLLAFARRRPLEPRLINLNGLISSVSELLSRTMGENIKLRTVLLAEDVTLEVDPAELEGALLNLAVNARDAMPNGGELVIEVTTISFDDAAAAANEIEPGHYVCIGVADSGCGIPNEVLNHVFEPFFTTKSSGLGTGLGLSQVYGFAKQSRGNVKIYSEPSMGTTVKLYLPRGGNAQPGGHYLQEENGDDIPQARPGETVLVVEDDEDVRNYSAGCLRRLGYQVVEAAEAATALRILADGEPIDLLFTDLGLPGPLDGRTLAGKAREIKPSLPVLITTAYAAGALVHDGRLDRDVELLNKPFVFAQLARRIRQVLDRHPEMARTKSRILIVEDEYLLRNFVGDVLKEAGYETEEAASFAEALTILREKSAEIQAAVIDIGLPDRGGDSLVPEIRNMAPKMPVVLATGFNDEALTQRFTRASNIAFLLKPFTPEVLLTKLRGFGL